MDTFGKILEILTSFRYLDSWKLDEKPVIFHITFLKILFTQQLSTLKIPSESVSKTLTDCLFYWTFWVLEKCFYRLTNNILYSTLWSIPDMYTFHMQRQARGEGGKRAIHLCKYPLCVFQMSYFWEQLGLSKTTFHRGFIVCQLVWAVSHRFTAILIPIGRCCLNSRETKILG